MKHYLLGLFYLIVTYASAQEPEKINGVDSHHLVIKPNDSLHIKDSFLKAQWEAHSRTFFISTINEGDLKDDYALASGIGVGFLTKPVYGFQIGVSGFFFYNITSSNIELPDQKTQLFNRYELGLFDVSDPTKKYNLNRLEDLFLKYHFSKSALAIGKINISTPFLNPQDGRMRPTIEEGVWMNINESKKIGFNGGWIWAVSPRSTVQWYSLENSIGVYQSGVNIDGSKSDYHENINSSGIAIGNIYYTPNNRVKINLWDGLVDNVMNTSLIELNTKQNLSEVSNLYQGLIFLHQDAINHGGNIDQSKTYINERAQSNAISVQVGIKTKRINSSLNYTHITGDGRYLMPREWGKEPFYTFQSRERNEGYGNLHAVMLKSTFNSNNKKFKTGISYGYYHLPDVKDFRLNKYGMPSYHQISYEASYHFGKFLEGLEIKTLITGKLGQGETYNNLKYVYNKVNMLNFNLIIDFKI